MRKPSKVDTVRGAAANKAKMPFAKAAPFKAKADVPGKKARNKRLAKATL